MQGQSCCTPAAAREALPDQAVQGSAPKVALDSLPIPGGMALLGTDSPELPVDEEAPLRRKKIRPFRIMPTVVTNAQFAAFVEATGYKTEAERFGWSFVFFHNVSDETPATLGVQGVEWWRRVDGAFWACPNGPGSQADCLPDHPVVQVSWNDARAFARWAGGRLPTEAEWEHAARGGLGDVPFPWGTEAPDDSTHLPCNIWQGQFPQHNTCADGWRATAPAQSFAPNGYGLYNMCGNVWEWTSEPYRIRGLSRASRAHAANTKGYKLLKGGSFLCHRSYCFRYRIPARSGTTPDTGTSHQGFRLVFDGH